jgi:hypothetical protein
MICCSTVGSTRSVGAPCVVVALCIQAFLLAFWRLMNDHLATSVVVTLQCRRRREDKKDCRVSGWVPAEEMRRSGLAVRRGCGPL